MARPTKYSKEIADKICEELTTSSKGLAHICKKLDIHVVTVFRWIDENEEFRNDYMRAREAQADFLADEILEIADDSSQDLLGHDKNGNPIENKEFTNRSRLKVDARKFIASKLKPKKYGDKLDVTSGGEPIKKQVFKIGDTIIEL